MKKALLIVNAFLAVYWVIKLGFHVVGYYEPSAVEVGFLIALTAFLFIRGTLDMLD